MPWDAHNGDTWGYMVIHVESYLFSIMMVFRKSYQLWTLVLVLSWRHFLFQIKLMPSGKMVQVAIWMTFACICFSAMNGIVRHLGGSIEPIIVVFFRCLFGLVGMAPFLLRSGLTSLHTQNPLLHGIRGLIAVVGMCCWFYGINHMPLAEAVALGFTTPLFSSIAAVIHLG